jgi:glyoxylase-like metal-dependent hydrolase (beta-lactamase superfamily II)
MRLVAGLHMAEQTLGGRVYLLEDSLTCVLIDTGAPDGTLGAGELLHSAGRQPHEIRLILLTHAHRGHSGNAAGLRGLTRAPVAASAATAAALAEPASRVGALRRLLGGGRNALEEAVRVDRVLEPGETVDLGGGIAVLDAPGHAAGALAFHLLGPDALCFGDAASAGRQGVGPPPLRHCEDPAEAVRTAARLAGMGVRVFAPGHAFPLVEGRLPVKRRG